MKNILIALLLSIIAPTTASAAEWSVFEEVSKMDGRKSSFYFTTASEVGGPTNVKMLVSCGGEFVFNFSTSLHLDSEFNSGVMVSKSRIIFDDGAVDDVLTLMQAPGAYNYALPIYSEWLMQHALQHSSFRIQLHLYGASSVVYNVDLSGFKDGFRGFKDSRC
jgi:hypothetical protein